MTPNTISPPLAAALADRGYQSLTAVQQAVLAADVAGRDLLVSAQTGSGKTVAFGIAVAPDLLGNDTTLPDTTSPLALAIAPTRELALQVAAELTWLYAATQARIATCVGGMDYRTERRALERGAHIVVGTPGRLRDHIERGGLDLSQLRVAVLDEADEMLDLGFREDLEFILQRAPESRRTLMFSATVPAAIEALARDFQRDALRLAAMGEARQHGDIAYRALSVAVRDRENAIFNLLRFHDARTAIVFCKTRANVNHLLARMNNRGFRVVALSGELSQQERTHALQALRDGRSNVCIATDVAARGIDLPGLELVVHADLPTNSETLLHRSGRTGRAGAKGVSALIVTPAEYRKAQRLLQGARVVAEWGRAPSADDVSARDDARLLDHPALATPLDDMAIVHALLARVSPEQVAAAFVKLWREGRPPPEDLIEVAPPADVGAPPRAPREFGASVWFSLSVGHTGRAEARWLLPKVCEAGGITRDAIGAIRVRQTETYVQIARDQAARFGDRVEIEPELVMTRLPGDPLQGGAPQRAPERPAAPTSARPAERRASPRTPPVADLAPGPAPRATPGPTPTDRPTKPRPAASTGDAPGAKPRWSKAQKDAKGGKREATPRQDAAPPKAKVRPSGKPPARHGTTRPASGGRDTPRRPKGRG
ncbi:MAG: DEAD/DEAH box helicase [Rhodobacteraceae bacterium]|jgi:ATP-dependent RNA helicase DeaD|nr:DEAD/DEAH box helicase [Paracoccaceae bacterium]